MVRQELQDKHLDKSERKLERTESVACEASAGMEELISKRLQDQRNVKQGGHSGITNEFGRPEFFEGGNERKFLPHQGDGRGDSHPPVQRNEQGQVTDVNYPNGRSRHFEYGEDGQLNRVTNNNGSVYSRESDGWHITTSSGAHQRLAGESFEIDGNGNFVSNYPAGRSIERPDGSLRQEYRNGGAVERAPDGRQSSTTFPDGHTLRYGYDSDGRFNQIQRDDGTSVRRGPDGWANYDSHGRRTNERVDGSFGLGWEGDLIHQRSNGSFEHQQPDGRTRVDNPDGSSISRDSNGRVDFIHYPANSSYPYRSFHYSSDGQLRAVGNSADSEWRREADGWSLYSQGRRTNEHVRDIEVDRAGNVTIVHEDGSRETTAPNGSNRPIADR